MYRDAEAGFAFHRGRMARHPILLRLVQLVHFAFGLLACLLALKFVLVYVSASPSNPLVVKVTTLAAPLVGPFAAVLRDGHDVAGHPISWSVGACLLFWAVVMRVLVGVLRGLGRPSAPVDD
jgi:hypothetical protein